MARCTRSQPPKMPAVRSTSALAARLLFRSTPPPAQGRPESAVEFSFRAGIASDYIYRGVTLSAHGPAAGAAFEAAFGVFYAGGTVATVKLPSQPAAEMSFAGGVRPKLGNVQFDFGVTSYIYPNETPPLGVAKGIDYWEAMARADTTLGGLLQVAGGFAWSPNVSNTGAWSNYAAVGMGFDLPGKVLPSEVSASVTGGVGYSWFGNQSAALGGFPLPAYLPGTRASRSRTRISISICATPTPTCRRKIASCSLAIRTRPPAGKSIR